jgi:hypothetical protein
VFKTQNSQRNVHTADGRNWHGGNTFTPATNLHVFENTSDKPPALRIEQAGSGDAALRLSRTSAVAKDVSIGLNSSDDSRFEISSAGELTGSAAYTAAGKMMRINLDASNPESLTYNHQSRARVFLGTVTPVAQGADDSNVNDWVVVPFESELFDEHSDLTRRHTPSPHAPRILRRQCPCEFDIVSVAAANAFVSIAIIKNTGIYSIGNNLGVSQTDGSDYNAVLLRNNAPVVSDIVHLLSGETIQIRVFQNTGSAVNLKTGSARTYVSIHKAS